MRLPCPCTPGHVHVHAMAIGAVVHAICISVHGLNLGSVTCSVMQCCGIVPNACGCGVAGLQGGSKCFLRVGCVLPEGFAQRGSKEQQLSQWQGIWLVGFC